MSGETGKKRGLCKRILALLTVLCMAFTLAPAAVLADTAGNGNSVTVYVSVSDDGEFVVGNDPDKTVMMRVPVTVDYFDLADYGLEKFYRYEAGEDGEYTGDEVIEQPTLLHCYIRILEQFYLGGEKLDLKKHSDALTIGGTSSPTSLYMTQFWGHDENLMYYVDHQYPLMREGWGATSDWILLEDGMEIDLAMFSDWNFHHYGAFAILIQRKKQSSPAIP